MRCQECGSYAINHECHGRDGSDGNLCDVCYWRKRAEAKPEGRLYTEAELNDHIKQALGVKESRK